MLFLLFDPISIISIIPPDTTAESQASGVSAKGEVDTGADNDHDKTLAALFDPVPVEALEKMFPACRQWKEWTERAARNGLKAAREGRRRAGEGGPGEVGKKERKERKG